MLVSRRIQDLNACSRAISNNIHCRGLRINLQLSWYNYKFLYVLLFCVIDFSCIYNSDVWVCASITVLFCLFQSTVIVESVRHVLSSGSPVSPPFWGGYLDFSRGAVQEARDASRGFPTEDNEAEVIATEGRYMADCASRYGP